MFPLYAIERPMRRTLVTWVLIGANTAVFVGELLYTNGFDFCLSQQLFYAYGLVPYSVTNGVQLTFQCSTGNLYAGSQTAAVYLTLLTSLFVHGGYLHLIGNMLFLFVFGPNVEARFGRLKYLASYLAFGVAGSAAMLVTSTMAGPPSIYIPEIGASGAISGVLASYLVLLPSSRVVSVIGYFIMPVRAFWFIGAWFVLQVLYQLGGINTGVAYAAHIGGFLLGLGVAALVRAAARSSGADAWEQAY